MFSMGLLNLSRFEPVRSVSNTMDSNRFDYLEINVLPNFVRTTSQARKHWLKRLECLQRGFEANGSRLDSMLIGCSRDDRANQVVSQHVNPNFLANEVGCFATQLIHLQRLL